MSEPPKPNVNKQLYILAEGASFLMSAVLSNLITSPFKKLNRIKQELEERGEKPKDQANKQDIFTLWEDYFEDLLESLTNHGTLLFLCKNSFISFMKEKDLIEFFIISGSLGAALSFIKFPQKLVTQLYHDSYRRDCRAMLKNRTEALNLILLKKGISGLFDGSLLYAVSSFISCGTFVSLCIQLEKYTKLKKLSLIFYCGGIIVAEFFSKFLVSYVEAWKREYLLEIARNRYLKDGGGNGENDSDSSFSEEEAPSLVKSLVKVLQKPSYEVHFCWINPFWANSVCTATTLTIFSMIKILSL